MFLTNTLEPIEPQANLLLPAISAEVEAAQEVKDREILVILGNPPYSGHSKNKGAWISAAIDGYKYTLEIDEAGREVKKPLGEKNPKWLNDDYVKFIRFAQLKMDAVEEGIVGVITNHSWLDNPTFRGMRQSLMRSFEQIYVLDLHGNAKKKEHAPDGSKDENVFDIEQGVAISLFVKRPGLERGVWRGDLWGKRLVKYHATASGLIRAHPWCELRPILPDYLLKTINAPLAETDWKVADLFVKSSVGVVTGQDRIAVQFTRREIKRAVEDASLPQREFELGRIVTYAYRPFDNRFTFYTGKAEGFHVRPRTPIMSIFINRKTEGLVLSRQAAAIGSEQFDSVAVTSDVLDFNYFRRGGEQVFPITDIDGAENLSPDFRAFLEGQYDPHYTPEEILGYIYAVLHAPTYRSRYAEFLRIDFPRIPFPEQAEDFEALSELGWALVQAHLLREMPRRKLAGYHGKGDHAVEAVRYSPSEQSDQQESQYFKPVPQAVWDFYIGGYQVLNKYLKLRKGRVLSLDEINHVSAIADSLAFTIEQMAKIDKAYRAAFPDRG